MRGIRVPEFGPPPAQLEPYRMRFLLPRTLMLGVQIGRHHPCLHQCLLEVDKAYVVRVRAPTREKLFAQASAWLRTAAKGHIADGQSFQISAKVQTPARICAGLDSWTIVVGADVAFAPTGLGVEMPKEITR
jgi:hypothetical protein